MDFNEFKLYNRLARAQVQLETIIALSNDAGESGKVGVLLEISAAICDALCYFDEEDDDDI